MSPAMQSSLTLFDGHMACERIRKWQNVDVNDHFRPIAQVNR